MTTEAPPELFVVGSGRSGTTIVLEAIGYLDDVATVPRLAGRAPKLTGLATRLARHGLGPAAWVRPSSESTALFVEAGLTQDFQAALGRSVGPAEAGALHMDRLGRRLASIRHHANARTVAVKNTASCGRIPHPRPHLPRSRVPSRVATPRARRELVAAYRLLGRHDLVVGRSNNTAVREGRGHVSSGGRGATLGSASWHRDG